MRTRNDCQRRILRPPYPTTFVDDGVVGKLSASSSSSFIGRIRERQGPQPADYVPRCEGEFGQEERDNRKYWDQRLLKMNDKRYTAEEAHRPWRLDRYRDRDHRRRRCHCRLALTDLRRKAKDSWSCIIDRTLTMNELIVCDRQLTDCASLQLKINDDADNDDDDDDNDNDDGGYDDNDDDHQEKDDGSCINDNGDDDNDRDDDDDSNDDYDDDEKLSQHRCRLEMLEERLQCCSEKGLGHSSSDIVHERHGSVSSSIACAQGRLKSENRMGGRVSVQLATETTRRRRSKGGSGGGYGWIVPSSYWATTLLILSYTVFGVADACSSRSTPKPRPPTPTPRPNITFHMYTCPLDYAEWYCLNGATCFTVKIVDSLLYNCLCANGYIGQRCEFKDLDGSYLPSRQRVMLETASIAGGATIAVFLVVIICIAVYIHCKRKQKELRTSDGSCVDTVDGPCNGRDPELRPFSQRSRSLMIFMAKNPTNCSTAIEQTRMPPGCWNSPETAEPTRLAAIGNDGSSSSAGVGGGGGSGSGIGVGVGVGGGGGSIGGGGGLVVGAGAGSGSAAASGKQQQHQHQQRQQHQHQHQQQQQLTTTSQ